MDKAIDIDQKQELDRRQGSVLDPMAYEELTDSLMGLSGELAARVTESRVPAKYGRVCTEETIPYSRELEDRTLPGTNRIVDAALKLLNI